MTIRTRPQPQVTGGMGSAPPPANPIEVAPGVIRGTQAPSEITQPLDAGVVADQVARAHANERSLAPLNFAPAGGGPAAGGQPTPVSAVEAVSTQGRRIRQVTRSRAGGTAVDGPANGTDAPVVQAPATISDLSSGAVDRPREGEPWQPAASQTDSPSRGIPRNIPNDPGKQITGGFGDVHDAQYFPLDGTELRELIMALMDQLHARLQDDLRFTVAICYPRVRARVEIIVEGFVEDQGFIIPRVAIPHDKTPLALAREYGDEITFALVAERVEMTAAGDSVSPPNATRLELGLPVPRKQTVDTPTGRMLVDVPN
jgi:hypothetical protein